MLAMPRRTRALKWHSIHMPSEPVEDYPSTDPGHIRGHISHINFILHLRVALDLLQARATFPMTWTPYVSFPNSR
jgi:hypothetical protein